MKNLISLLVFIMLACTNEKSNEQIEFSISDIEAGNINLRLNLDNTFLLKVDITPMAEMEITGDFEGKMEGFVRELSGTWKKIDNEIILSFINIKKGDIHQIFNDEYDEYKTVEVIDNTMASFKSDINLITIRGVHCQRVQ
jgi:hypothetical protein